MKFFLKLKKLGLFHFEDGIRCDCAQKSHNGTQLQSRVKEGPAELLPFGHVQIFLLFGDFIQPQIHMHIFFPLSWRGFLLHNPPPPDANRPLLCQLISTSDRCIVSPMQIYLHWNRALWGCRTQAPESEEREKPKANK